MRPIGFSTGALALGDFRKALAMLSGRRTNVIELSALRDLELEPLMRAFGDLDLRKFTYISIHVPSKFKSLSEAAVAKGLMPCIDLGIPIVIHPDAIREMSHWIAFGSLLCIENMDKRKPAGRTAAELEPFFTAFPKATFCLDVAHARQVDSTMMEARQMLRRFGSRLRQVHISEIDTEGHHHNLSLATVLAVQSIASLINEDVPIIVESMITEGAINRELEVARRALTAPQAPSAPSEYQDWGALA